MGLFTRMAPAPVTPPEEPTQLPTAQAGSALIEATYSSPPETAHAAGNVDLAISPSDDILVELPTLEAHHVGIAPKEKLGLEQLALYSFEELKFSGFAELTHFKEAVEEVGAATLAKGLRNQLIIDVGGKQTFLETDERGQLGYHYICRASVDVLKKKFLQDVYNRLPTELKDEETDLKGAAGATLARFTTMAHQTVFDMTTERTFYNRYLRQFVKASCPPRKLLPREDKNVAKWLELLGGEAHEKLLDWLAVSTDLTKPVCALYFHGATRGGKTLLALGLNRYWNTDQKATPLWRYFDTFNNDVTRSGILLADEELGPADKAKFTTTSLRDLITSGAHDIFTKNQDPARAKGFFRVIMASNHSNMLDLDAKGLDPNSLEAVSLRFLPIEVSVEPANFIRSLGGQAGGTKMWVDGDVIARHALWLRETRQINPGVNGLWVEGNLSASRNLLVATGPADTVLGTLADIIDDISRVQGLEADTVFIGQSKIFVVMDKLRMYLEKTLKKGYQRRTLGNSMTNLQRIKPTNRPTVISVTGFELHPRVFDIDPQYLMNYMEQTKSGDPDKLAEALSAPIPLGNKGVNTATLFGMARPKTGN